MDTDASAKTFTSLYAWQEAHTLVLTIYQHTRQFPRSEQFVLASQLQRAAISITSNLAEGFVRNTLKDKIQFYHISLGSLTESQNQLILAHDLGYISTEQFHQIMQQTTLVSKLINGLIKSLKSKS